MMMLHLVRARARGMARARARARPRARVRARVKVRVRVSSMPAHSGVVARTPSSARVSGTYWGDIGEI